MSAPRRPTSAPNLLALFCTALLAAGCGGDGGDSSADASRSDAGPPPLDTATVTGQPDQLEYAPELGVDLDSMQHQQSGLYVRDLAEGDGATASPGDTVVVHYTGWLPNGRKFDGSRERGEPAAFPLSQGGLIAGWLQGVSGMREGGRRLLVLPPDLAYGEQGSGPIPPNAVLVFDIELLEVR